MNIIRDTLCMLLSTDKQDIRMTLQPADPERALDKECHVCFSISGGNKLRDNRACS